VIKLNEPVIVSKKSKKLRCWRNSTLSKRGKYDLLITGSGYSSTGFFAKAFTDAGYPLGHEMLKTHGTSDWKGAARHNQKIHPFQFNHVVLLLRHPLKVLNSWYGTGWDFGMWRGSGLTSASFRKEMVLQDVNLFEQLTGEFRLLESWISLSLLGENIAECAMHSEDIGGDLLLDLCHRADFEDCDNKDWQSIDKKHANSNSHNKQKDERATWEYLEGLASNASNPFDQIVLSHARRICLHFGYSDC